MIPRLPWSRPRRAKPRADGPVPQPELTATSALDEPHDKRLARATVAICAATVFAGFLWAAETPVDEITVGRGLILTQQQPERVEHPDGGVVAQILAQPGDDLAPGDTILTFDATTMTRELTTIRAQIDRLSDEADRLRAILREPKGRLPDAPIGSFDAPAAAFWAEQSYLAAQLDILAADRANIARRAETAAKRRANMQQEGLLLDRQFERTSALAELGTLRLTERDAVERERIQLQGNLLTLTAEAAEAEAALTENTLRRAELIAQRQRDAALRQTEIEEQLVGLSQNAAEIEARIARAVVRSEAGGRIQDLTVATRNEVVGAGELIAEVIAADSPLEAEVEVAADRIGAITPGMETRVKIMSYDFTRFGVVEGAVAAISPTSFVNPEGQVVFRVRVALADTGVDTRVAGQPVRPGMTVVADIKSGQKTVLGYLLKPLRALQDRALTEG
ncbi:MAG: HlyD family type I secretion periplasmic adaptor subunit [Pseudomonadota bacterium]